MSKLRHFFRGYLKHYLVWTGFLLLIATVNIFNSGNSNAQSVNSAELGSLATIPFITAPIYAFITLGIYKVLRKIFGSKDIM